MVCILSFYKSEIYLCKLILTHRWNTSCDACKILTNKLNIHSPCQLSFCGRNIYMNQKNTEIYQNMYNYIKQNKSNNNNNNNTYGGW